MKRRSIWLALLLLTMTDVVQAQSAPRDAEAYYNRGVARDKEGDFNGAIADFTQAITLNPNHAKAYYYRGFARNKRARDQNEKRDLDGEFADYTQAIKIDPMYADAYIDRGNVRRDKGDLDGAIDNLGVVLITNPEFAAAYSNTLDSINNQEFAAAYSNRGNARRKKDDLDGAIADHTKAIRIDLMYAGAYNIRGVIRRKKGDLDGAIADFTQALTIIPDYAQALENLEIARAAANGIRADANRIRAEQVARPQMQTETTKFRLSLKVEAETNCGPVIEMRGGLVKIYFPVANYGNEHWVQKGRLFPPGYGCRFVNGQYRPPYDF